MKIHSEVCDKNVERTVGKLVCTCGTYPAYKASMLKQGFTPVTFKVWRKFDDQDQVLAKLNQEVA